MLTSSVRAEKKDGRDALAHQATKDLMCPVTVHALRLEFGLLQ
jgi:hypothetical protein